MKFPLLVARRYLFSKKSTNAINVITGIAVLGIGVGTAALILGLSVFNGFEDLLTDLMNAVNADLKVVPAIGKTFEIQREKIRSIESLPGVESVSLTLEETVMVEYLDKQDFCTLKGVEDNYAETTTIDSALIAGTFKLSEDRYDYIILGAGIANRLGVDLNNPFESAEIFAARPDATGPMQRAFKSLMAYPIAFFSIKQDYDYTYIFGSLAFTQALLGQQGRASAIEIRISGPGRQSPTKEAVQQIVGDRFVVKDRYEQEEALFKLMNIEKWISYAILSLSLLIVSFNMVGSLWMIVLDKKKDIAILRALGADARMVRRIFLNEGLLISGFGIAIGFVFSLCFYLLQKEYGIITIPEGFVVSAYPIRIRWMDFVYVACTVSLIGILASVMPANRASRIPAYIKEE